jgi:pilus assembly protein Flp/PilA
MMMNRIFRFVQSWWMDEEGVTSIEYALLGSLIALVIVVSVNAVGLQVCQRYKTVAEAVSGAMGTSVTITCS